MTHHAIATKKRRERPEEAVHRFAVQLLKLNGVKGLIFYHCPNGEVRSRVTAAILVGLGVRRGVADLCLVLPGGRAAFLELKAPKGRSSPEQKVFRTDAEAAGALYAVATTSDEVQAVLSSWGALRRSIRPSEAATLRAAE